MPPKIIDTYKQVEAKDRTKWRAWLAKNHAKSPGVWLVFYKKASGKPTVRYDEAVEEALCYGWIDSLMRPVDGTKYRQLFTPRKPKSAWSKPNKERVARMIAAGLMTDAGLKHVEGAKTDGRWTAGDAIEALVVPADLRQALSRNKRALKNFQELTPGRKKLLLRLIDNAKRPETRLRRIEEAVARAAEKRFV